MMVMRKILYIFFISKNNNNNVYNIELKKIAFKNNILKYIFVIIFKIYSKNADVNIFFFLLFAVIVLIKNALKNN